MNWSEKGIICTTGFFGQQKQVIEKCGRLIADTTASFQTPFSNKIWQLSFFWFSFTLIWARKFWPFGNST
jgi:hypothetical protein